MATPRTTPSVSVTSRLTSTGLLLIGLLLFGLALLTSFEGQAQPLTARAAAPDSVATTGVMQVVLTRPATSASLRSLRPTAPHYSPVIDRTAAGVRVMPDFSARAHQPGRATQAAARQTALTQRARQLAAAYNTENNLLK